MAHSPGAFNRADARAEARMADHPWPPKPVPLRRGLRFGGGVGYAGRISITPSGEGIMRRVLGLLLGPLLLTASAIAASAPEEVTTCGQVVERRGYLAADLDCSGATDPGYAVWLERGAVLELRGFTITGSGRGVLCIRSCSILGGGGTITGTTFAGVNADRRVQIRDLTIRDNAVYGVVTNGPPGAMIDLRNATVTGNGDTGVGSLNVQIRDTTITGNGRYGIYSLRGAKLRSSLVTGSAEMDIWTTRAPARLRDSTCGTSNYDVCGP
jgi:hypothetical protein